MKILLLNQDWFAEEFREAGHEVVSCGMRTHLDVLMLDPLESIESIIGRLPDGFKPDKIVVYDESAPVIIEGLFDVNIPTLFYSVDTHHHAAAHKYLANVFDYTLVAQKDYLPIFHQVGASPEWFPLWASRHVEASDDKEYGAVFVGTMKKELNPQRIKFFDRLKEKIDIKIMQGKYWEIFPYSEIVVNQTVKGDLNFRVFEAMMSGALLLTESSKNGLEELFTPGEHLITYQKNKANEAALLIDELLADTNRCRAIACAGREEILRAHLPIHRAARVLEILENLEKRETPISKICLLPNFMWAAKLLLKIDRDLSAKVLSFALKSLSEALLGGENINDELAMHAVTACVEFDRLYGSDLGEKLVYKLDEAYPQMSISKIAIIWFLVKKGEREVAEREVDELREGGAKLTCDRVVEIMSGILGEVR